MLTVFEHDNTELLHENIWISLKLIYSDSATPFMFQKDNAASHTANYTKMFRTEGYLSLTLDFTKSRH